MLAQGRNREVIRQPERVAETAEVPVAVAGDGASALLRKDYMSRTSPYADLNFSLPTLNGLRGGSQSFNND